MRSARATWVWPAVTFVAIGVLLFLLSGGGRVLLPRPTPSAPAPPPEPAVHLNTRSWRVMAQDPTAHAGARVILWGQVTQFDPAADPTTFRANVDAARHTPQNGAVHYPTPVILHAAPDMLHNLAQGYIFTAEATVTGASNGVPTLTVTKLTITDKTVG